MKKIFLSALAVLSATMFTSCNDMLDTDPRVTEMSASTFPGKPADVEAMNAATYSIMNILGGGDCDTYNPFLWWEVMSDNCYGSGGLQDNKVKSLNNLVEMNVNQYQEVFITLYGGVNRANSTIETIDNVPWKEDQKALRATLLGEAYFMRGLYTLWLTQLYGDIPLITKATPTPEMEEQVSAEEVIYPQIFSDFVSAKTLMSTEKRDGHANKYAAESFLARAYMFWAGFYKGVRELAYDDVPHVELVEQEGCEAGYILTKEVVIDGLKDVYQKYELCPDFRSLWQYSNSILWNETQDPDEEFTYHYDFIKDMREEDCFDKPGRGNGNVEEIFQIQFMNASKWAIPTTYYSQPRQYSNYLSCFWGLRVNGDNGKKEATFPFNEGWGQGTPSCNLWDDWTLAENNQDNPYKDMRKLGSMIDCVGELASYSFVKDDCEESGYAVKKYADVCTNKCEKQNQTWWSQCEGYTGSSLENEMQGDHFQDFYLMRYADVLLMLSELTGDKKYMNEVRMRGLGYFTANPPSEPYKEIEYSLENIQNERRWEFAFEGLRFNDMRRWSGPNPTESSYAPKALQAQAGKLVVVKGDTGNLVPMKHMTCSWTERYIATNGFLSKPQAQINLMNGKLVQNPGWDPADAKTQYVTLY